MGKFIKPPFVKQIKSKYTIRKNIFRLEHCVSSDFYKCYHIYQLPKVMINSYSQFSNGVIIFSTVLNIIS